MDIIIKRNFTSSSIAFVAFISELSNVIVVGSVICFTAGTSVANGRFQRNTVGLNPFRAATVGDEKVLIKALAVGENICVINFFLEIKPGLHPSICLACYWPQAVMQL
jgi:hypothetical protein